MSQPSTPQTLNNPAWWALAALLLAVAPAWRLMPHFDASGVPVQPLAPALALALAGAAVLGWRALPAVAAGAALAVAAWPAGEPDPLSWSGAALLLAQAALGGLLLRRSSRTDDLALDSPGALQRLVATALACALLGALATLALALAGAATARPFVVALVRAVADGATVLLLLPVVLAFVAPPRERWQPRRRSVALPLLALAVLLVGVAWGIDRRDRQHAQVRFDREADVIGARIQAVLDTPLHALIALQAALHAGAGAATAPATFDTLAQPWLARGVGIGGLGWLEVAPDGSSVVRHHSGRGGAVADGRIAIGAAQQALLRGTLERALAHPEPVATPVLLLGAAADPMPGIVVLQALPAAAGTGARSVVFVTVPSDRLMAPLMATRGESVRLCLFDADPQREPRRLHGRAGCDTAAERDDDFRRDAAFDFAERAWLLRIEQPIQTPGGVWLFALPALGAGALLALMLLALTGRMQRLQADARQLGSSLQQRASLELDTVMQAVQTGIALLAPDGRIERANRALADLLALPPGALIQQPIDELLIDADPAAGSRIVDLLQDAGAALVHRTVHLRRQDGRSAPVLMTLRALREPDGRIAAAVCAVHDLSENLRRQHAERMLGDMLERAQGPG